MFDKKAYMKQWREKNKEKIKKYNKQWQENNPEYIKQWQKANSKRLNKYIKQWQKANSKRLNKYRNQWRKDNSEHYKEQARNYIKYKRMTDLKFNLNCKISCLIWQSLKENKAGRKWETLVGYTLDDLIKRLKKTMPEGYSWNDFMRGKLHIDHIIPKSAFNYAKPEHMDFSRCWGLKNLRLLSKEENLKKSNKLSKPFQPALQI